MVLIQALKLSKKDVLAELDEHNDFFDMMVDMVPPKIYGVTREQNSTNEAGGQQQSLNTKYHKKASEPAPLKMKRQQELRQQVKRRKLNPEHGANQQEPTTNSVKEKNTEKKRSLAVHHSPDSTLDPPLEKKEKKDDAIEPTKNVENIKSRIESLRTKLQAKIAEKQQLNRPNGTSARPDQISKRAARRAEKKKRQEEAKKRASQKKSPTTMNHNVTKFQLPDSNATPAQDLARVDFGRLTGLNPKDLDPTLKSKKMLENLSKPKNLHKLLADAEAKQAKLEQLKKSKQEKDQETLTAIQWKDTFHEADGTRVKDDPTKLKKALKRKVVKKAKSQKAWQSRTEQVTAKAQERQQIRQHNLMARKQGGKLGANLSRKEIRTAEDIEQKQQQQQKQGTTNNNNKNGKLSRAGFEGRKQGFLNKEKKAATTTTSSKGTQK